MAEEQLFTETALTTVINTGAALTNGSMAFADFTNVNGDLWCDAYLVPLQYVVAPAVGTSAAELYLLPSEDDVNFPTGGSGTTVPQGALLQGIFESVAPSTTVDERLCLRQRDMPRSAGRYVIRNISGQTFDVGWQLRIRPYKLQII